MEYIFTNLPQYIRQISRTAFSNSVVQSGSVLLFSEDGTTLTAKLPDGSFVTVGGSGGTDVSDTTATAADVLSGKDFYLSTGVKTTGSIQTVTASASGNVVTVPAGYIASQQTLTIGTAKAAATYTPGTTDQTITAGQYLTGDQTIKGDANLLAANIVQGVTIFGVTGLQNAAGMSMTAPSAITGNFSFCVKAYIAPDAALSGSCRLLDTNSWGGALFALWANSDSGTYPMLSMRGYSFEAYSAPDMSNVSGVHTLVMTYNTDGTTKLYFDNVLAASEYYDPGFDHSQTLYLLGDPANVLTLGVAAYNRELTAAEAASIIW